ncbi:hypothetical protein C8R43DRAFT_637503 [Mycena crocata]|nr:hypothetical protein C8R43DRAFT_637503 [Mycena crocata]
MPFPQFGEVREVRLARHGNGKLRGFGYVTFIHQEEAMAAVTAEMNLLGRPIYISYSMPDYSGVRQTAPPSCRLILNFLPSNVDEAYIRDIFKPFGELASVSLNKYSNDKPGGFANVDFMQLEQATCAFETFEHTPLHVLGAPVRVEYGRPPHRALYFRGYRGNEQTLRVCFQDFEAVITNIYLGHDRVTGQFNHTGLICFKSVDWASKALQKLQGTMTPHGRLELQYKKSYTRLE